MKSADQLKTALRSQVDAIKDRIVEIADYIHKNPEIGYAEYKASDLLCSELEQRGFAVTRKVAGLETAFKAVSEGTAARPRIGILAEYDALPGLGHACGHNLSAAAAVGAALALAPLMPELAGTLAVYGTPAEEGVAENAGGKIVMLKEFEGLDAAMMMHALDMNTVICDSFNREALEIEFIGKSANAGNAEDASKGINALEGVMLFWHAVNAQRLLLKNDARIFGIITEGGVSPNIIPDRAVTKLQIRVEDDAYFQEVVEKVKNAAGGAARSIGAGVNIRAYANTYRSMLNNRTLAQAFARNLSLLGIEVENLSRRGVATDMGNVSRLAPAIHPFIAVAPKGTPWHSTESAKASASTRAHEATIATAKAFGMTAIDMMTDPNLVQAIRTEFEKNR
jgi:amidohydrolase